MALGLRERLLLCVILPPVLLAGLAAVASPTVVVAVAAVAAAATAGGVYLLTRPFERLRQAAGEAARQVGPGVPPRMPGDGTNEVAHAIGLLLDAVNDSRAKLASREQQFAAALDRAGELAVAAADVRRAGAISGQIPSPWPERSAALVRAIAHAGETMQSLNRKVATLQTVLADLPAPLLVVDAKQQVTYANLPAEKLFALKHGGPRPSVRTLFAPPPASPEPDLVVTGIGPEAVSGWLARGDGGEVEAATGCGNPVTIAAPARRPGKHALTPLLVRDLSAGRRSDAAARQQMRRSLGQRLCRLVEAEVRPAVDAARTHAALIGQAAKQSGQKDRFVPKVERLTAELDRQAALVELVGWFGRMAQSLGTTGDPDEVRLKDAAADAVDRLSVPLADRGNTAALTGDGGWLMADPEWLGTLLTGMVSHANQAAEKGQISLALGRRSAVDARGEFAEIVVRHPGQPMPEDMAADVLDPFRRSASTAFDPSGPFGFPLGLAVAHRAALLLGGRLEIEPGATEQVVRAVLPTRAKGDAPAAVAAVRSAPVESIAPDEASDALAGFFVGGGPAAADDDEDADAADQTLSAFAGVTDTPPPMDDTVGNWFGRGN